CGVVFFQAEDGMRVFHVTGVQTCALPIFWWHRFARVDDWLLYVQESPNARGGRGLATGRMYTQHGALVATIAQEIMIRVPDVSRSEERRVGQEWGARGPAEEAEVTAIGVA